MKKLTQFAVEFNIFWRILAHVAEAVGGWVSIAWYYDNSADGYIVVAIMGAVLLVDAVWKLVLLYTRGDRHE